MQSADGLRIPSLSTGLKSRLPAVLCALVLLTCVIVSYPVAETGMVDDWSYVQSARVLAQTGDLVFNGWATAIVGWQLYLGALFVKLFGPSFTSVRFAMLPIAMATAFLTQRSMVRAGIHQRNATIGTLALMLSPLCLPLVFSFMTDMSGLFCIVLCLYACLRALDARTEGAMLAWLAFAAISNALGGTARQIAWLGVLVMFPSTVWLLRRRPRVVALGATLYIACAAFIFSVMHWFKLQPYSVPEPLLPDHVDVHSFTRLLTAQSVLLVSAALFLLPGLVGFIPAISLRNRRTSDFLLIFGVVCLVIGLLLSVTQPSIFAAFIAPYAGNYVTQCGLVDGTNIKGERPVVLMMGLRILISVIVLFALGCFFAFLRSYRESGKCMNEPLRKSWKRLLALLVPFLLSYFGMLTPRGMIGQVFDRYLLPVLLIALILLLRLYQDRVQPNLPPISIAVCLLFALYSVAGTHDAFSLYRARAQAIEELRQANVADTAIDGGFEWNAMTQIGVTGFVNDPRIRVPSGVFVRRTSPFPKDCQPDSFIRTPALVPGFALSFDPHACGGLSQFPPVPYRDWLRLRKVFVYIVRVHEIAEQTTGLNHVHAKDSLEIARTDEQNTGGLR